MGGGRLRGRDEAMGMKGCVLYYIYIYVHVIGLCHQMKICVIHILEVCVVSLAATAATKHAGAPTATAKTKCHQNYRNSSKRYTHICVNEKCVVQLLYSLS